jgi:kumamolisin
MFTAITEGDNKMSDTAAGFDAGPGWDPCTGFGTPRGQALLAYLREKLKDG